MAKKRAVLKVEGVEVALFSDRNTDYISLTDMAKYSNPRPDQVISNWLRNRNTVEFLGVWEQLHNPNFNGEGFDQIRMNTGLNTFFLSPKKWIEETSAIGLVSKSGRGGGTYAHRDIAFEFCSFVSPVFKLYVVKEFQRLKLVEAEGSREVLDWELRRSLTKLNHKIHTDAIKETLIPPRISRAKKGGVVYASEADVLNVAVFGMTAKEWRGFNPEQRGNIRDHATTEQLLVLANLEAINAEMIRSGIVQDERVDRLNEAAISQMRSLLSSPSLMRLPDSEKGL